ncbi:MAG: chromophore lyase CpcT/CpeT [Planctomycetes bacterium]|nr:chromophore lyase CpcT/CpeT [Planctomycetota bacterium]
MNSSAHLQMTIPFTLLVCALMVSCRSADTTTVDADEAGLDRLVACMIGSFDSSAQAAADKDYRDIQLHMSPIFGERDDGCWLYVEQAAATAPTKPYRQRVYRVHAEQSGFVSDVYTLPGDALRFAGAWRDPALLAGLTAEQLTLRDGCSIHLVERADGVFAGSTRGEMCASELNGASFATSRVEITESLLASWDRGFDAAGKQVWGAQQGPYIFIKRR